MNSVFSEEKFKLLFHNRALWYPLNGRRRLREDTISNAFLSLIFRERARVANETEVAAAAGER